MILREKEKALSLHLHSSHQGLHTTLIPDEQAEQRKQMASTHYRQGNSAYLAQNYTRAIECYTCALEQWADDAATWNNRGMSYVASQLIRTGIRDYNQAIALSPSTSDFYYKRGVAYSLLHHFATSIEDYTICLKLDPKHADALNNRGNALKYLGYLEQALVDLTHACELYPDHPMYHDNLIKIQTEIQQTPSSVPLTAFSFPTPICHGSTSQHDSQHGFQLAHKPPQHDIQPQPQQSMMLVPVGLLMNQEIPGWKRVDEI